MEKREESKKKTMDRLLKKNAISKTISVAIFIIIWLRKIMNGQNIMT